MENGFNKNLKIVMTAIISTLVSIFILNIFLALGRSNNVEMFNNSVVVNTLLELVIFSTQVAVLKMFRKDKFVLDDLGLKFTRNILKGMLIAVIITAAYSFLVYTSMCLMNALEFQGIGFQFYSSDDVNLTIFNAFMIAIFAGICEEVFFSGVLCNYLSRFKGTIFGIVVSSMIFSLFHSGRTRDIRNFIVIFSIGILLGYLFIKTKSLYLSITVHFMVDFTAFFIGLESPGLFVFKRSLDSTPESLDNVYFISQMLIYIIFILLYFIGKKLLKHSKVNN